MDTLQVFVRSLSWEADDVLGIEVEAVDGMPLPGWEPGAHIGILLPMGTRHYSLCGDYRDTSRYRIAVLLEPVSRGGSTFLHDLLRPGHMLDVTAPSNHFALESASGYRFIAGGIGITPMLPMVASARENGTPWALSYIGRSRWAMAYADEVARMGPGASLFARDEAPRPDLSQLLADPSPGELVYVCGPPSLVDAVRDAAERQGWPSASVHSERFLPVELDEDTDAFTFRQVSEDGATGDPVPVGATESLVDALERTGVEVESACREGICGTCRIDVVEGEIIHRDAVLTEDERAAGNVMMACVSRARGPLTIRT